MRNMFKLFCIALTTGSNIFVTGRNINFATNVGHDPESTHSIKPKSNEVIVTGAKDIDDNHAMFAEEDQFFLREMNANEKYNNRVLLLDYSTFSFSMPTYITDEPTSSTKPTISYIIASNSPTVTLPTPSPKKVSMMMTKTLKPLIKVESVSPVLTPKTKKTNVPIKDCFGYGCVEPVTTKAPVKSPVKAPVKAPRKVPIKIYKEKKPLLLSKTSVPMTSTPTKPIIIVKQMTKTNFIPKTPITVPF